MLHWSLTFQQLSCFSYNSLSSLGKWIQIRSPAMIWNKWLFWVIWRAGLCFWYILTLALTFCGCSNGLKPEADQLEVSIFEWLSISTDCWGLPSCSVPQCFPDVSRELKRTTPAASFIRLESCGAKLSDTSYCCLSGVPSLQAMSSS